MNRTPAFNEQNGGNQEKIKCFLFTSLVFHPEFLGCYYKHSRLWLTLNGIFHNGRHRLPHMPFVTEISGAAMAQMNHLLAGKMFQC